MKRKLKWTAIVLAMLLLGFGVVLFLWPRDRITAESWHKIRIGMTEEDAAEILGGPGTSWEEANAEYWQLADELGQPPFAFAGPRLEEPKTKSIRFVEARTKIWNGRRGQIVIELDQNNCVCWKTFHGGRWTNGGILDRLRDWLGW